MTKVKPDGILLTSLIDVYLNYDTLSADVVISGSVADTSSADFTATIPYARGNTRADLYARNLTTDIKRPISGGNRQAPYTFTSSEVFTQVATYDGAKITVTFTVTNNTGGSITLVTQTLQVTAVLIEVPY